MARSRPLIALALLLVAGGGVACGGSAPVVEPDDVVEDEDATPAAIVRLEPPGSRLSVSAPAATRVPHTLRYRAEELELRFADAQVPVGAERATVEAYLTQLTEGAGGELSHRPFAMDGAEGMQVTLRTDSQRTRVLTLWHEGAISRLTIVHRPADAALAERIVESLRFDPDATLDPRAALEVDADPTEGLPLLRVSTEQLLFREGGHAVPFPSAEAALDVVYVSFGEERPSERARGQLLGARFAGLHLGQPRLAGIDGGHLPGFSMMAQATIEGGTLIVYGAYLELAEGAFLVRASVDAARGEEWLSRFMSLVGSLRSR